MTNSVLGNVAAENKKRKNYFPFQYLLNSQKFQGQGARVAQNLKLQDGFLQKTKGQKLFKEIAGLKKIINLFSFQNSDGSEQIIYCYKSGNKYKIKAIKEDGSEITPTNDVEFTSEIFDFVQIGKKGFISNFSATTPLFQWDGITLAATSNAPTEIKFLSRDGLRLVAGSGNLTKFSGGEIETNNNFTTGAGVKKNGDYASTLQTPTAAVSANTGVVIFGEFGAEAHWVQPNAASDDLSDKTKIQNFSFNGRGVSNKKQVCVANNYIYFFNDDGIFEMNPYSGQVINLADTGEIKKIWENTDFSFGSIAYDNKNDFIVIIGKYKAMQNNVMFCVNLNDNKRSISMADNSFFNCLVSGKDELFGGSSFDGKIIKIFSGYSTVNGNDTYFRFISERDGFNNSLIAKKIKRIYFFISSYPQVNFTIKLYFDGYNKAAISQTFSTPPQQISTTQQVFGKYVFNFGKKTIENQTESINLSRYRNKFSTFSFEIIESSTHDFIVHDFLIEYETTGRLLKKIGNRNNTFESLNFPYLDGGQAESF